MSLCNYWQGAKSVALQHCTMASNIETGMETESRDISDGGSYWPKTSPPSLHRSAHGKLYSNVISSSAFNLSRKIREHEASKLFKMWWLETSESPHPSPQFLLAILLHINKHRSNARPSKKASATSSNCRQNPEDLKSLWPFSRTHRILNDNSGIIFVKNQSICSGLNKAHLPSKQPTF